MAHKRFIVLLLLLPLLHSCSKVGPGGLFRKASPHEKYGLKLSAAGLETTSLGKQWLAAADSSLSNPLSVSIPYKERGYFPAERVRATALRFEGRPGEKISINVDDQLAAEFNLFVDLWEERDDDRRLLAFRDTGQASFDYEIEKSGFYILRLQPELLRSGNYTLSITSGPSLAFPVKGGKIQSFWGAGRDGGTRSHEGIDIFAPRRSPALAAAPGRVTRVSLNNLGGKVVFMRPNGKNYNLYYAHLDEQLATEGQEVKVGDTIGLVGSTGNARGGAPHLHFGIYTSSGAVDPLPFVNPVVKPAPDIKAPVNLIGRSLRTTARTSTLYAGPGTGHPVLNKFPRNTLIEVSAAAANWFKVILPDGSSGYFSSGALGNADSPVRQVRLSNQQALLDAPHALAPEKRQLQPGTTLRVLGEFNNFQFVTLNEDSGWIKTL